MNDSAYCLGCKQTVPILAGHKFCIECLESFEKVLRQIAEHEIKVVTDDREGRWFYLNLACDLRSIARKALNHKPDFGKGFISCLLDEHAALREDHADKSIMPPFKINKTDADQEAT